MGVGEIYSTSKAYMPRKIINPVLEWSRNPRRRHIHETKRIPTHFKNNMRYGKMDEGCVKARPPWIRPRKSGASIFLSWHQPRWMEWKKDGSLRDLEMFCKEPFYALPPFNGHENGPWWPRSRHQLKQREKERARHRNERGRLKVFRPTRNLWLGRCEGAQYGLSWRKIDRWPFVSEMVLSWGP